MAVNIIGYGYVGSAMAHLCEQNGIPYNVYDTEEKLGNFTYFHRLEDLVAHSEGTPGPNYYFIAVPTPSNIVGACDTSIVENVLGQLHRLAADAIVIIKSTVEPGTCDKLHNKFKRDGFDIVFNPEYLTEKNYLYDIYDAKFVLLGSKDLNFCKFQMLLKLFRDLYAHNQQIDIISKSYTECELFKYTVNNFLAVKVWYFNKIYDTCDKFAIDYSSFKSLFELEPRLGEYGTRVPGDHGRGYAGSCLRKEQYGMIRLQEKLELDNSVLTAMAAENETMRLLKK
jgi:UDPglucose 6-dehydrogenase